jgi:hypothetical protein
MNTPTELTTTIREIKAQPHSSDEGTMITEKKELPVMERTA